jgi:methyl-accepting chemotaxis protein
LPFFREFSFRLTYRILAIGIVGVAGVILVGGIHMYAEFETAQYSEAAEKARAIFELSNKIKIELLESRRAEKDFLLRNDRKKADVQREFSNAVAADTGDLQAKLLEIGKTDLAGKVKAMAHALKNYQTSFGTAVQERERLGLNEDSGLAGRLRDSVRGFEAMMAQLQDKDLLASTLMMRRHEKDFMLKHDETYGDEMSKEATRFAARLKEADIPEDVKAGLKQKLADYQRDFSAWSDTAIDFDNDLKAASTAFSTLEPAVDAVSKSVVEMKADADMASFTESAYWGRLVKAVIILIAASSLGISIFIGRSVSRPLSTVKSVMNELAAGNFSVVVPGLGRSDEIGEIAQAVEIFKKNGLEVEQMRTEQRAIEKRNAEQRKADMIKLADSFETAAGEIIETVSSASKELETSASMLASTAERTKGLTTSAADASGEASGNVKSVATSTELLSSSVNEIALQVQESARIASEAVSQARQTNERVGELSKAASRIGDVVELIHAIAGQTNLLALNATIEAARAGDAGRGFAVVASEVKALAQQTAKATDEIGQQITGIQTATQESVASIQRISSTIERLSGISSTIASSLEEQGTATQQIARSVQRAAVGTQEVSSNIIEVQRGASDTGSASSLVLTAAQRLSSDSGRLKGEVDKFLASVRTA